MGGPRGPDPKALEGFARALKARAACRRFHFRRAMEPARAGLKPLFIEIATAALASPPANAPELSDDALARAGNAFAEARSVNGAQALAWQRIRVKDYVTAAAWFKAAHSGRIPATPTRRPRRA